jgi:hypothetical protein
MQEDDNSEKKPTPIWVKLVMGGCVVFALWFSYISRPFWDGVREFQLSSQDVVGWLVSISGFLMSWEGGVIGFCCGIGVYYFQKYLKKKPSDDNNEDEE